MSKLQTIDMPFIQGEIAAGFPSPAAQYAEEPLDLNSLLVKRPAATFFLRVSGESMVNAGIYPGDILVVDRSLSPADGSVVVACIDNEFTVKYFRRDRNGMPWLMPANRLYRPIFLGPCQELRIFGVVTANIHMFGKVTSSLR